MDPGGHQSGNVGHVHHEEAAHLVGDLAEPGEVDDSGIGGGAGQEHLGLHLQGEAFQGVIVNGLGFPVHAVAHEIVGAPAEIHLESVGEVSAGVQAHAQDGVSGFQEGEVDLLVGLAAGVGLHIGGLGPEEFLGAVDGQLLDLVHVGAPVVVAFAGEAFRVFVGEDGALGGADGGAGEIFAGDEFQPFRLSGLFLVDEGGEFRVHVAEGGDFVQGVFFHLVQSSGVSFCLAEGGVEPCLHHVQHFLGGEGVSPGDQDIAVVVVAAGACLLGGVCQGGTDSMEAVGEDGHSDAAAADENAEVGLAPRNVLRDADGIIRIVATRLLARAAIEQRRHV